MKESQGLQFPLVGEKGNISLFVKELVGGRNLPVWLPYVNVWILIKHPRDIYKNCKGKGRTR